MLRLWRDLPLPLALRGLVLWSVNARFLIGVVGLVWDGDGRLLMARHSYLRPPGWGLPGGWLQANETFEAGVARELAEELGFEVEVGSLVSWARQRVPPHFTLAFECRLRRGVFRPSLEILEIGYFPPEQALALLNPDLRPVVAMALARRAQAARS